MEQFFVGTAYSCLIRAVIAYVTFQTNPKVKLLEGNYFRIAVSLA